MTELEKILWVQEFCAQLHGLFPDEHIQLTVRSDGESQFVRFGLKTYAAARQWFRDLGVQRQDKKPHAADGLLGDWTALRGRFDDKLSLEAYPDELPPTCRKVKKIERIPKTQTVQTGEFIEIEREVIECGEADEPQTGGQTA